MVNERNTNQRAVILDYLRGVKSHPTAKAVYLAVRKSLPHISLGTIYRNLDNLSRKQLIQEILAKEAHYDGDNSCHAHFICQKCSKIFDIWDLCKNCKVLLKKKLKVGKIKRFQIKIYGECKNCIEKK
jgi:Fe2+ or Zn2+ uptake regulation protein